jgi:carboxypeptidase-like protein
VPFFVLFVMLEIGCAPPAKPSSDPFFLERDTPVDSVRVASTEVVSNASIPIGEADGIVVDAYWGTPVYGAQVLFRDLNDPAHVRGTVTDVDGHFRLTNLPHRSITIRTQFVAYTPDTARLDGKSGHFVRFGLRGRAVRVCGLPVAVGPPHDLPFAVTVYVRDSRTSAAPRVPVTIRLRDGSFVDSATVSPGRGPADSLAIGAARDRDGVYDVEVTAPGYKPWYLKRVRPVVTVCGQVVGRDFPAWLIPTT